LATFPPHLHFSRLALNNIADPLFGTLALACLGRGLRHGRRFDFALGGAALGLTQYFYEGGRLLYPILALVWVVGVLMTKHARYHSSGLQRAVFAALVVAAPIYTTLAAGQNVLMPRLASRSLPPDYWLKLVTTPPAAGQLPAFFEHLADTVRVYTTLPDKSLFYGGGTALILPYLVPGFGLGLIWAAWRGRTSAGWLLLCWLLLTSLGNSLLVESAHAARYVVAFPALALLLAIGIVSPLRWLLPQQAVRLAAAIGLTLAVIQVGYYFGPHLARYNQQIRFYGRDGYDALFRAVDLPTTTQIHIIGPVGLYDFDAQATLRFLGSADLPVYLWDQTLDAGGLARLPDRAGHAFFLPPDDRSLIDRLRARFPKLQGPFATPYNVPFDRRLTHYYAPPQTTP
jgi:hypothetical protein